MAEAPETHDAPDAGAAPEASAPPAPSPAPAHPDVARMDNAHARGDFREARAIARRLAAGDDASLREQGQAMLARHRADPVIVAVLVGTGALIVALAGMYLGHPQHPAAGPRARSAGAGAPHGGRR